MIKRMKRNAKKSQRRIVRFAYFMKDSEYPYRDIPYYYNYTKKTNRGKR